jgi:adenylosuccinate lyase
MPFKQNPILSERIGSLARLLPASADVTWQNAATNYLERTLDDSANRRVVLPEALLCADEIVTIARTVIDGLRVDERRIATNLRTYAPFAGTQAVMLEAVRAGGDRQRLHEVLRSASMEAWAAVGRGEDNPLSRLLTEERVLTALIDPAEIRRLLDPSTHVGTAPQRARLLADRIDALAPFPRQIEVRI